MMRAVFAFLMLVSAAWSVRLAWACWLGQGDDAAQVARAARLWPRRAEFHLSMAALDAPREQQHLTAALAASPRSARAMIPLALLAEAEGRDAEARHWFARARQVDRRWKPAWAGLGYADRTGDPDGQFWPLARQAFAMSHRDRRALFELCWRHEPGSSRLLEVAGPRAPVLLDAVQFLQAQGDLAGAETALERLLAAPELQAAEANAGRIATREERRAAALDLCDQALHVGDRPRATRIWRHFIRVKTDSAWEAGASIQRGLDWRRTAATQEIQNEPNGWTFAAAGGDALMLWRPLPELAPGRYRLAAVVEGDPGGTIRWQPESFSAGDTGRLEIWYRRRPGTVPPPGLVTVRDPRWERIGP